ncbi:MAG: glycosyltransferase [bacterium]
MISFIIPTLNEEKCLDKILSNLASYTGDKEIIVSDGNSKDRTVEIAKKYTDKVYVYTGQARQTIGMGKNLGAEHAVGEFLLFLDTDVRVPDINTFLPKALAKFADPKLLAIGARLKVEKEHETWADLIVFSIVNIVFWLQNNVLGRGAMSGEFQMFRTEAFRKIGGYNPKLVVTEDQEIFANLAKIGKTRVFWDTLVYHSGRRAHKLGWPKLLWQWTANYFSVFIFKKSVSDEWKPIR